MTTVIAMLCTLTGGGNEDPASAIDVSYDYGLIF